MRSCATPRGLPFADGTPLSCNGRRVRLVFGLLAALMLSLHLMGIHVGHGEPAAQVSGATIESPRDVRSSIDPLASFESPHGNAPSFDHGHVDVEHEVAECGDAAPTRDPGPASFSGPSLKVVWAMEPIAHTYSPTTRPAPPRRTPCPVSELGILRV